MASLWILIASALFNTASGTFVNVALGKDVKCLWNNLESLESRDLCPKMVDGDLRNVSEWSTGSTMFADIELNEKVTDPTVKLFGRLHQDFTLEMITVKLSCGDSTFSATYSSIEVTCQGTCRSIYLRCYPNNVPFYITEIKVLVCSEGSYGDDCTKSCSSRHCVTTMTTCPRNGSCSGGCEAGWMGKTCTQSKLINVALGVGTSCVRKIYEDLLDTNQCPKLVDGDVRRVSEWSGSSEPIIGADIELKEYVTDPTVKVFGKSLNDLKLTVKTDSFQHVCGTIYLPEKLSSVAISCPGTWRTIQISNNPHDVTFSIMEIEVLVCSEGAYGDDCTKSCSSRHCVTMATCPRNGSCSDGCEAGWIGKDCTKICANGKFGLGCESTCGHCNGTCNVNDGHCPDGCEEGYEGRHCARIEELLEISLPRSTGSTQNVENKTVLVVASALGVLLLVTVVGIVVFCVLKRIRKNRTQHMQEMAAGTRHSAGSYRYNRDDPPADPIYDELMDLDLDTGVEMEENTPYDEPKDLALVFGEPEQDTGYDKPKELTRDIEEEPEQDTGYDKPKELTRDIEEEPEQDTGYDKPKELTRDIEEEPEQDTGYDKPKELTQDIGEEPQQDTGYDKPKELTRDIEEEPEQDTGYDKPKELTQDMGENLDQDTNYVEAIAAPHSTDGDANYLTAVCSHPSNQGYRADLGQNTNYDKPKDLPLDFGEEPNKDTGYLEPIVGQRSTDGDGSYITAVCSHPSNQRNGLELHVGQNTHYDKPKDLTHDIGEEPEQDTNYVEAIADPHNTYSDGTYLTAVCSQPLNQWNGKNGEDTNFDEVEDLDQDIEDPKQDTGYIEPITDPRSSDGDDN